MTDHLLIVCQSETAPTARAVARQLHDTAVPALEAARFVVFDCAAVPAEIAHSELFGHNGGSAPGVYRDQRGLTELNEGDMLFLEGLHVAPPEIQQRLAQLLWSGEFKGRLIATTYGPLDNSQMPQGVDQPLLRHLVVVRLTVD